MFKHIIHLFLELRCHDILYLIKENANETTRTPHSLNNNINILLTVLHTFLEKMLERICSNIQAFHLV